MLGSRLPSLCQCNSGIRRDLTCRTVYSQSIKVDIIILLPGHFIYRLYYLPLLSAKKLLQLYPYNRAWIARTGK